MRNMHFLIRELRGEKTQEQFAEKIGVSRETLSRYETGRIDVPITVLKKISEEFDNPEFNMRLQSEFIGTGPVYLDGPNADLHRSAVKEKTLEELEEAISSLKDTCLSKPLKNFQPFEIQKLRTSLEELVEASTAILQLIAVLCLESGISYKELWTHHYLDLESQGYIGGIR